VQNKLKNQTQFGLSTGNFNCPLILALSYSMRSMTRSAKKLDLQPKRRA